MTLYQLIGSPAAGKSTYAANLCREKQGIVCLNADELRGLYGKDESDQSVSYQAFKFIESACHILFRQGFSVAIDVTSKNRKARAVFLDIAKKYGAKTVAVCFTTPLEICQARNAARARVVPPDVVARIHGEIVLPLPGEFDEVRIIKNY